MLTHIVFFKLKERNNHQIKQEICSRLQTLPAAIKEIKALEVGIDIDRSARAWDVALLTRFASQADLEIYRDHPAHLAVVAYIREVTEASSVVDWEG